MITARTITNGSTYLKRHLRANDYYAEGEKVEGEWIGKGAKHLGLHGTVHAGQFEALRENRHPFTGERLTARDRKPYLAKNPVTGALVERKPIALHDITFSAPKTASIVAIIGGDARVTEAFQESVRTAIVEMEHFAAVRLRTGAFANSEKIRISGNLTAALFFHDSSRALDPQLHAHAVMANASLDVERNQWLALQRRAMMEASPYVRRVLYRDFARRLRALGYQLEREGESFRIVGISTAVEVEFSLRARQRVAFATRYLKQFGHQPSKRRVEHFIKEDRDSATVRFTAEFTRALQREPTAREIREFVIDWREVEIDGSASLSWTAVEKCHWPGYRPGHVLNFPRAAAGVAPAESIRVREVLPNGLRCEKPDGTTTKITRKQRHAFDVAEPCALAIAAGDALLFRANCPEIGVSNGDRLKVLEVEPGRIRLASDKILPPEFTQVCHGHAVTSHKSQGASVEESILVMAPHSLPAANLRQFYVSNTRFKHRHCVFVHDKAAIAARIGQRSERLLAREFLAELGQELHSLLRKSDAVSAKQSAQNERITATLRKIETCVSGIDRTATRNRIIQRLGLHSLPERFRKFFARLRQARRSDRRRRKRSSMIHGDFLRKFRGGLRVFRWYRRGVRNARFRALQHQQASIMRRR